jgi:hypothetical protein
VTRNALHAGRPIDPMGGGLFTTFPVTQSNTTIAHNVPDQCAGC